jgi:hypothetical protein
MQFNQAAAIAAANVVVMNHHAGGHRLLPGCRLEPASYTCTICAYVDGVLKPNGDYQSLPDVARHNATTHHNRRVLSGRMPPAHVAGVSLQNPPLYRPVVRCVSCTLDPNGQPRVSSGSVMYLANVAAHVATENHHRRLGDGRLAVYDAAHRANPGRLMGELW